MNEKEIRALWESEFIMCNVKELLELKRRIKELEAQLALPKLKPAGTIDINLFSSILLDKLDEIGDNNAELYLADKNSKIFDKETVMDFLGLNETDKIVYVPEEMDCDDFAAELFGKGVPLVWTVLHALSWFIDTQGEFYFIEPQTDKISKNLEGWQGSDIRFFLSR